MIVSDTKAALRCMEPGCTTTQPAEMILLVSGGFGFRLVGEPAGVWQFTAGKAGEFQARCHEHHQKVHGLAADKARGQDGLVRLASR